MSGKKIIPYPDRDDPNFGSILYKKREFQVFKYPERLLLTDYDKIKKYRDKSCLPSEFQLQPHQSFLSNFINLNTPYNGVLIFHGTGTGKTCAAITIAENFKEQVIKHGTKIIILASGPTVKQNFTEQLLGSCTAGEYFDNDKIVYNPQLLKKMKKNAAILTTKYYKMMSYKTFLKKVLGEKIKNKYNKYVKSSKGKYKRNISSNPITYLNNTIIIVDEAHNLIDNNEGKSLQKIIRNKNSVNLKLVLMTATPMKNVASGIVYLVNLLRPLNDQMKVNKIFDNENNIIPGGKEYFIKKIKGYISYLRGDDPLTFPKMVEMGEIPKGLEFTKLVKCQMENIQLQTYLSFDKKAKGNFDKMEIDKAIKYQAISNIVVPGLDENLDNIRGYYGNYGLKKVKSNLTYNRKVLFKKLRELFSDIDNDFIYISNNNRVTGTFLNKKYLHNFSSKFSEVVHNLENNVVNKNGPGTSFIYSTLIPIGINMFEEVLSQNGYMKYGTRWNNNENIKCYYCGIEFGNHDEQKHEFYPSTYISITGQKDEKEDIEQDKLRNTFVNENNIDGKYIKVLLGSSVFSEGANLKNIKDVHILEGYYHLTRIDQIIGRAIRFCSHYKLMNEQNPYPEVKVYKYAIGLENKMTQEENLYRRAEDKYKKIKKVERIIKENAIDCPFNINKNIFPEEVKKYKDCKDNCPKQCDFTKCEYKCNDPILNKSYYDEKTKKYRPLEIDELDNSTFNLKLLKFEKKFIKDKIKELFRTDFVYTIDEIIDYILDKYPHNQKKYFEEKYLYLALDEMIPKKDDDFNNFNNIIKDKYNREGYIIYRNKYYIFQPFNENEEIPMQYRREYKELKIPKVSLNKYLSIKELDKVIKTKKIKKYDFNSAIKYYSSRKENNIVGIITKGNDGKDVFNIRPKRERKSKKKRYKGLHTTEGANCLSKSIDLLRKIASELNIKLNKNNNSKLQICDKIKNKLLMLEKYSTGKEKLTYMRIPYDHPTYPFPYNLEDRILFIKNKISKFFNRIGQTVEVKIKDNKVILTGKITDSSVGFLQKMGGKNIGGKWIFEIID